MTHGIEAYFIDLYLSEQYTKPFAGEDITPTTN